MDWKLWHDRYDDPASAFTQRLATVRERVSRALDEAPAGPLRAISLCAGQGRDLIPVLAGHPRGRDVHARLVELEPDNAQHARAAAAEAGLGRVEVVTGDASLTDHYLGLAPADLVLVCGVYGNLLPADIENTVATCAALCATGGTAIWTCGRKPNPPMVSRICAWHEQYGFEEVWLEDPEVDLCVGEYRYRGTPRPLQPGVSMFEFVGYDVLYPRPA
ncbi:SAM-dependent methyltransferase [Actinospica sp.]|jgi:hypothetical protein|uniref:SAM-dependent methyltransferase n=1 Tax=Actinospica sp. TaxID=1872142 RepID=UPI002BC5A72C|nr:SAM-dependent methyltransferase [Actinospica sp.]HWG23354.1 SAM-dependent methyltransferase [Actinospica sp.]